MSEEVALGQVTVADLQPGDRVRIAALGVRTVAAAQKYRWLRFKEDDEDGQSWHFAWSYPVELLSADQDDDDAIREALYESTAEVER